MSAYEALTLREYTKEYFHSHQKRLHSQYPGLTLNTLYQELEGYGLHHQLALESLFEQIYLPSPQNPISQFFKKMEKGIPLAYITGHAYFFRSEFTVGPGVLIPRPETELLVERAVAFLKSRIGPAPLTIADVGVGSGAIVLSVLRECPFAIKAIATDISEDALRIARRNHYQLHFTFPLESEVQFVKTDRLENIQSQFDLIMTNPPYIPWSGTDVDGVHPQVLAHEPFDALFVEKDQYQLWFENFFKQSITHLKKDGLFLMEGHENELQSLKHVAEKAGFTQVEIHQDLTGRDRYLTATIKDEDGQTNH
jgi:release factor glutamine methyltransferase